MNPCTSCGACCAAFRVDFDPAECDDALGGCVPHALADRLGANLCRMIGTDRLPPRCVALSGSVGSGVQCGIYEQRPSPCREFEAGSEACLRARRLHRLGPIE
ncbi:MAG: YkgJ family cysteine cluster protein [Thermomicrobiales bacterium]|nr:MAG: YkgJ family cysteine cluster protein [Thermomicrobiales bacterium]